MKFKIQWMYCSDTKRKHRSTRIVHVRFVRCQLNTNAGTMDIVGALSLMDNAQSASIRHRDVGDYVRKSGRIRVSKYLSEERRMRVNARTGRSDI